MVRWGLYNPLTNTIAQDCGTVGSLGAIRGVNVAAAYAGATTPYAPTICTLLTMGVMIGLTVPPYGGEGSNVPISPSTYPTTPITPLPLVPYLLTQ